MADILARGLRAQPALLDQAVMTAPVSVDPVGGASQAERGLRSSLAAQSAGALAAEGLSAEIAGRRDVAAEKYRQAELMKTRASETAPRVTSLRDVGGVDDFVDFAAGGLPQVLTSTVPAMAGALVGRGIGGRIGMAAGGLVPAYNMEANETAGELALDPQARARMTPEQIQTVMRTKGALNAGLEVAGPAYLIERALGKTATREGLRGAAKTIGMGAALEGPGTELPQEIIGQAAKSYARTGSLSQEIDPWALADATALGAMGGGTMAAPAAGVQLGREALQAGAEKTAQGAKAVGRGVSAAVDLAAEKGGIALDAAKEKADPLIDRIKSRASTAYDATKMDWLVANTEQIPDEIAGDPEAVMQHIAGQDVQRKQYIADYLNNIVNTAEDPARVQQASDMLSKLDDPETFRVAAQGIVAMEKTKQFQQRVRDFDEDMKDFAKGFMDGPKKKANAQGAFGAEKLDPTNQLITQSLVDAMPPEATDAGADKLIPFFRGMFSGKTAPQLTPRIMRDFIGVYGDRAVEVAASVSQFVTRDSEGRGLDAKQTVKVLQDFMADEEVRSETRRRAIEDSLTNDARLKIQTELGRPISPDDTAAISDLMTRMAEGTLNKTMKPRVEAELKKYLGDRYTHTLNIFRAMHDAASQKAAPLVHAQEQADVEEDAAGDIGGDVLDYDQQREAQSFETMMDGKDREFSLASKATSGVGKMFDSREEAQLRWDEKIAPVHTNRTGRVIRGDEYAVLAGADPLALAAQYDKKFAAEPADFKARAALAKEAMGLLREKYAVQMDLVTNEDKDNLSSKDLATVLAKSQLPMRAVEKPFKNDGRYVHVESEGKHFAKDTKPTAAEGYIFVAKPDGKFRAVKMSALVYAITGKQQKEVFGGTADDNEGAPAKLRTVATALARVGDSGVLDLGKGAFTYNEKGEQQWLVRPGADQTAPVEKPTNKQRKAKAQRDRAALDKLAVGKSTVGGLRQKAEMSYVAKRKAERDKVRGVLEAALYEKIENAEARLEELREALGEAKASGIKAAIVDASNKVNAAKIAINKLNNYEITEADIDSKMMERDQTRAAERDGKTDTDPMLQASSDTRSMQEDDANFADVQRRTNAQNRYSGKARREANATKTEQVAEKESAALGEKEAARLTQNANKTIGYLNNPPADYTPEKAVAAKEWAQRWLTRTMGMTDVEDLRASLALVDKVASQMIEGDKAVAKMEGWKPKKRKAASAERTGKVATDEEVTAAFEYAKTVLGDKIQVIFEKDLGGLSGEWEEGATVNTIRIALNAGPGVLSVAHHEAMHEFFDRITKSGRKDVAEALLAAANSPTMLRKLERLLENEKVALKQIKTDPEERLAYMYQFWAAGELTVGPDTTSVFQKIAKFFRKVAGILSNDDRVADILTAFHEGQMAEPSAAARALDKIMSTNTTATKAIGALKPLYDKAYGFVMPAADVMADSDNPHAREIGELMHTSLTGSNDGHFGYLNATRAKTAEWDNRFATALGDLDADEVALLREVLSTGKKTTFEPVDKAAGEMRKLLRDFRTYMRERGVNIGFRKDYFPRVWNFEAIAEDPAAFKEMLLKHYTPVLTRMAEANNEATKKSSAPLKETADDVVERIVRRMANLSGVEQDHGDLNEKQDSAGFTPYMQAVNEMKLDFVEDAHAQEFLEQDLVRIMTSYLKQGVRRAEYENRFGAGGSRLALLLEKSYDFELDKQLEKAELTDKVAALRTQYEDKDPMNVPTVFELLQELVGKEKAVEITDAAFSANKRYTEATHAMEGTLGYDKISPGMRKFNSWMMTYQNIRLLPFVLFSSMIDPLGMIVRGGTLDDALAAYRRGFKEVMASWTGKESRDASTRVAELLGVIEHQSFLDSLGYVQESMYMNSGAKKLSDQFFKANGMEAWNRAMRTQATVAAVDFIKDHAEFVTEHSDRWLAELGLKRSDVRVKDGELVLFKQDFEALGMSEGEAKRAADKMQMAVNQWVDGSMLRPNAALRPSWSSDPRWALLFYLKQFTYAFQKTYISRVRNEYRYGNTAPMVAMLPFIPVMIASDVARGLIQNGGDLPNYMKNWDVGDYLMHGVQRAGLTGLAQFGIDEVANPTDILGPVVGQGIDLFNKPAGENVTEAIPGVSVLT